LGKCTIKYIFTEIITCYTSVYALSVTLSGIQCLEAHYLIVLNALGDLAYMLKE